MAVPSAGDFSASQLLRIQTKADQLWSQNRNRADYLARVEVLNALRARQTAQMAALQDPMKTNTVRLMWLHGCGITDGAVSDDCSISGTELSSNYEDYEIDIFRQASFSIKEWEMRTEEFNMEEKIAVGLLRADKALSEYLAQQCVSKLIAFAGVNSYTTPIGAAAWTNSSAAIGGYTEIPADQWDTKLLNRLNVAANKNKFFAPYLVSGEALEYITTEAVQDRGNDNGSGDFVRVSGWDINVDYNNVDAVGSPLFYTFMVDTGAVAIVNKNYNPVTPAVYQNPYRTHYQYASQNVPGLVYDAFYTQSCTSNEVTHSWKLKLNAGIYLNPTGCTETNTGVLAFVRPTGI